MFTSILCALLGLFIGPLIHYARPRIPENMPVCDPLIRIVKERTRSTSTSRGANSAQGTYALLTPRSVLTTIATVGCFAAVGYLTGPQLVLMPLLYLATISLLLSLIDLDTHRLPNRIVRPAYPVSAVALLFSAIHSNTVPWWVVLLGGFSMYLFFRTLYALSRGGVGIGDLKVAGFLGMYLAYFGLPTVFYGTLAGLMLAGLCVLFGTLFLGWSLRHKIAYGPFLFAGAWLAILWALWAP